MPAETGLRPEKKIHRLRLNRDFQQVYNSGRFFSSAELVLYCLPRPAAQRTRIGYTVARKIGGAVLRNRTRRRLRAIVRLSEQPLPAYGLDIVIMARQAAADRSYSELEARYHALVARLLHWLRKR